VSKTLLPRSESGRIQIPDSTTDYITQEITFSHPFSTAPFIAVTPEQWEQETTVNVYDVGPSLFRVRAKNDSGFVRTVHWLAVGT
jgi:hypothetical protein